MQADDATLECSACHTAKPPSAFTEQQLDLGDARRCPECTRAARENAVPAAPLEPAWGIASQSSEIDANAYAKLQIWLPRGTQSYDRKAWVARVEGTETFLPDRFAFTAPAYAASRCTSNGAWLRVHQTQKGLHVPYGIVDGAPAFDERRAPPHLRGRPPHVDARATGFVAVPARRKPVERKISFHVSADPSATAVQLREAGGSGVINLIAAQPGYWTTNQPVTVGSGTLHYQVVSELPRSGITSMVSSATGLINNTYERRSDIRHRNVNTPSTHIVDLGLSQGAELETFGKRAAALLQALITLTDEGTAAVYSQIVVELAVAISHDRVRCDLSGAVNDLLHHAYLNVQRFQVLLGFVAQGTTIHVSHTRMVQLLNHYELPSDHLLSPHLANLARLPGTCLPSGTLDSPPLWVALLRWDLGVHLLPHSPKPHADGEVFSASLLAFANSRSVRFWHGSELVTLLTKLCETAPDLKALVCLSTLQWQLDVHAASGLYQLCDIARSAAHSTGTKLRQALGGAWARCLSAMKLSELSAFSKNHTEYAMFVREAATNVRVWDGSADAQLAAIAALGFANDTESSKNLLRRLVNEGEIDHLRLFPHLMLTLTNGPHSGHMQQGILDHWVGAYLGKHVRVAGWPAAVADLYLFVATTWEQWNSRELTTSFELLRVEMLNLHGKKGSGGGMVYIDAVRILGKHRSFASSAVFTAWMLPDAIQKYLEKLCLHWGGGPQLANQCGEQARRILDHLILTGPQEERLSARRAVDTALTLPNELSELVVLCLLDILDPVVPLDEAQLLHLLLSRDAVYFWPAALQLRTYRLRSHRAIARIREAVSRLTGQLLDRKLVFHRAFKLLVESEKDGHAMLIEYVRVCMTIMSPRPELKLSSDGTQTTSVNVFEATVPALRLAEIRALQSTYDALEYFRAMHCSKASDFGPFTAEVARVMRGRDQGVLLCRATDEEYWGPLLSLRTREVAEESFRLRNSRLFLQEWLQAYTERAASTTDGEPSALTVEDLVEAVHPAAFSTFQANCRRMLDTANPITLKEVAHILGTPLEQAFAQRLEADVPRELELMLQGEEPTPEQRQQLDQLREQLICYARLRKTLCDASALVGLTRNLVSSGESDAAVYVQAQWLMELGELDANGQCASDEPLTQLFTYTSRFYRILLPHYKEALNAADQLGRSDAVELLDFVRKLEDDDLRDIIDSGEGVDKLEVIEAITSLRFVVDVLRPILRSPPQTLIGSPQSALEVLGAALISDLHHRVMTGIEFAGHVERCIINLHALTHCNKGLRDQAKDNIRAVIEQGTFIFEDGELRVSCANGARFSASELSDLRSHALLGIADEGETGGGNSGGERECTQLFLQLITASESICTSMARLRMLGRFGVYSHSMHVSELGELQSLQVEKERECREWHDGVRDARQDYYLLSLFSSRELWELYAQLFGGAPRSHLLYYIPAAAAQPPPASISASQSPLSRPMSFECQTSEEAPRPNFEPEVVKRMLKSVKAPVIDLTTHPASPSCRAQDSLEPIEQAIAQLRDLGAALHNRFYGATPHGCSIRKPDRQSPVGTGSICYVRTSRALDTCLTLHAADGQMPAHCQLLFCSDETSTEDLDAFLHRAFHADECPLLRERLFCVLHIGALPEVQHLYFKCQLERLYETVHPRRVRLALICDDLDQVRVSSDLASFIREIEVPPGDDLEEVLNGICQVSVVSSHRAGLGKTHAIVAQAAARHCRNMHSVYISGSMSRNEFVARLLEVFGHKSDGPCVDSLHINILDVPAASAELINDMLFELLCLSMVRGSSSAPASLVRVECPNIFIELANTIGGDLLDRLPICRHFRGASRIHLQWDANPFVLSPTEPRNVQLVCNYLRALDQNTVDSDVIDQPLSAPQCWALLDRHFVARVMAQHQEPSFAQIQVFVAVLAQQLGEFHISGPFMSAVVREFGHQQVRSVVVRCLVDAAARFALRSIGGKPAQASASNEKDAAMQIARQLHIQSFESVNYMLLLMQKDAAITVFPGPREFGRAAAEVKRYYDSQRKVFQQAPELAEWRDLPAKTTDARLRRGESDLLNEIINFLGTRVENRRTHLRASYEKSRYTLTADNSLKMMLIYVRICAMEPVIISGETGCGKTSLIKFLLFLLGMSDNFRVLNVHAGVTKERITEFTRECEEVARRTGSEVWVFFDEVNTSSHLAYVSELVCRRKLNGMPVAPSLRFLAAVNPYRIRAREVESVGLQSKLNTEDPMRHLVYRVHPLPEAMTDYVWDYGSLSNEDEKSYIANMLSDSQLPDLEAPLVFASQCFIRHEEEDCSVSLRDVQRFKKLVGWFVRTRQQRAQVDSDARARQSSKWWDRLSGSIRGFSAPIYEYDEREVAIVLALGHCYYCRLPSRESRMRYMQRVEQVWGQLLTTTQSYKTLPPHEFLKIVSDEQRAYVSRMEVPDHLGAVAFNNALLENVFVLLVCIVNKMPVFLVGKPGCSKTLSMQLILENLRGKGSPFPHLPCISELRYQCSEDSTSAGIEAIFERAKRMAATLEDHKQAMNDDDVIYVVVLDEIGLAEVSRHNPLKVLHDRLEPDARQEFIDTESAKDGHDLPYAVVGISNWALDSSKMNRAISLARPDPDEQDLLDTANAIVERMGTGHAIGTRHELLLKAASKAYFRFKMPSSKYVSLTRQEMVARGIVAPDASVAELQKVLANFHGLRDFYAFIRAVAAMPDPDPALIAMVVARNFNGLPGSAARFQQLLDEENAGVSTHVRELTFISPIELICSNMRDSRARHLMLISRGDAATCLLQLPQIKEALHNPIIMLASSFKEDSGPTYDYQQLSQISQHMMAGRQLIIKDFDSIYGALYDMLNQSYLVHKKRKCRVALENASKQVEVHEDFRCIMIEEERDLRHSDPPRLNRCEKQCLGYLDVLRELGARLRIDSEQLLADLHNYCHDLSTFDTKPWLRHEIVDEEGGAPVLQIHDAFIGFTDDTLPSLLVREMQAARAEDDHVALIRSRCKRALQDLMPADAIARSELSRFANNPDNEAELRALVASYHEQRYHTCLRECLPHFWPSLLQDPSVGRATQISQPSLLILTFTNYSCDVKRILHGVGADKVKVLRIGAIESEKTLRAQVNSFWNEADSSDIMLLQCDATSHSQHLLLTREIMREAEMLYTNVSSAAKRPKAQAIILHLRRFQPDTHALGRWQFSFLSEWKQLVVDRLEGQASDFDLLDAARAVKGASSLLTDDALNASLPIAPLCDLIKSELPWCLRRLSYPHSDASKTLEYVKKLQQVVLGTPEVVARLQDRLCEILQCSRSEQQASGQWLFELAHDLCALVKAGDLTSLVREVIVASMRQPLALLLYQLESRSALAGLRSCRTAAERQLWLDIFLPANKGTGLGDKVPVKQWDTEGLAVLRHYMELRWAYSIELIDQMRACKPQFLEMCAPTWQEERIASMRSGLCLQFLSNPVLRQLATLRHAQEPGMSTGDDLDLEQQLAKCLEGLWVEHREAFREDVQGIIATELASRDVGITPERIHCLVHISLTSMLCGKWHPADVCIQHWCIESFLRHALHLFLLIEGAFEPMSADTFAIELVDRAAESCLAQDPRDLRAWLSTAQRCINYAYRMQEDCDFRIGDCLKLAQLHLCADLCSRVAIAHKGVGREALVELAAAYQLSPHDVVRILGELQATLIADDNEAAALNVTAFQFAWGIRQLENAASSQEREQALRALDTVLREGVWPDGQVLPMASVAVRAALSALGLLTCYSVARGNMLCFGCFTAMLERSLRSDESVVATLFCTILQQQFVEEIWRALKGTQYAGQKRSCALPASPSVVSSSSPPACIGLKNPRTSEPQTVVGTSKRMRRRPLDEDETQAASGDAEADNATSMAEHGQNLGAALVLIAQRLQPAAPEAAAIYHLAYAKAFAQVACQSRNPMMARALNMTLSSTNGIEQPAKAMQEFILREVRRDMPMDAMMREFKSGELGDLFPSLQERCASAVSLATASQLGFDPFATYGEPYRAARHSLQLANDELNVKVECTALRLTAFAVTTVIYLPRSLAAVDTAHASQAAARLVASSTNARLASLVQALASNCFAYLPPDAQEFFHMRAENSRTDVFAASLAIHLAIVIESSTGAAVTSPLARYAQEPARIARANNEFLLCAPSDETAAAARAAGATNLVECTNMLRGKPCGFRYVIDACGQPMQLGTCPQCRQQIGGQNHNPVAGQRVLAARDQLVPHDSPGFVPDPPEARQVSYATRELSSLAYRALHLLVHLSLVCSELLGYSGLRDFVRGQGDATTYCWNAARRDLQMLPGLLQASGEATCAWMHALIERLPAWCAARGEANNLLTSAAARQRWETDFTKDLVAYQPGEAWAALAERPFGEGPRPLLHRIIDEESSVDRFTLYYSELWSTVESPSFDKLVQAAVTAKACGNHPFLVCVLENLDSLQLAQHLWPLIQWERLLREQWSTHLERASACEMTTAQLLDQIMDDAARRRAVIAFEQFASAWNGVRDLLVQRNLRAAHLCEELAACNMHDLLEKPQDIISMSINAPLTLGILDPKVCVTTKAGPGRCANLLRLFLSVLAKAQNDFLGMVVAMVPTCTALLALNLGGNAVWLDTAPQTELLQLQREHTLINDCEELKQLMLLPSASQTGYGMSGIDFDLAEIEANLVSRLLTGSRRVDYTDIGEVNKEAPSIFVFKGELLPRYRDLPMRVSSQMVQEPVANARSLRDEPFLKEPSNCRETLELLELVLYNATKTFPAPDERLRSYCASFNVGGSEAGLRQRVLQCTAIGEVPLKQLRSLYELVEDLVADAVLPALPQHFRVPLVDAAAVCDRACLALGREMALTPDGHFADAAAIRIGQQRLTSALKRFVYRELKTSTLISQAQLNNPLYDYVRWRSDFPWNMGDEVTDEEVDAAFPSDGDPALKHAYALWSELRKRAA